MGKYRAPAEKSKYYIPKETFLTVVHYCLQYPAWVDEMHALADTGKAITYDQERVQSSGGDDPTAEAAIRLAEISRKKDMIDETAAAVAGDLHRWLILGVCHDYPYQQLVTCGIPCGKNMYYKMRRRFYYEMSKKI